MVWSFVTVALLAASPEFQLGLADGTQVRGSLEAATAEALVLQTDTGRREIPASQLLSIAPGRGVGILRGRRYDLDRLIDGSQLWAVGYTVADGNAAISFGGRSLDHAAACRNSLGSLERTAGTHSQAMGKIMC